MRNAICLSWVGGWGVGVGIERAVPAGGGPFWVYLAIGVILSGWALLVMVAPPRSP
jgi:hypothetical protein